MDYDYVYFSGKFLCDSIHQENAEIIKRWNYTNLFTKFEGDIVFGRKNGIGRLTDTSGYILEGYWANNCLLKKNLSVLTNQNEIVFTGGGLDEKNRIHGAFRVQHLYLNKQIGSIVKYRLGKLGSLQNWASNGKLTEQYFTENNKNKWVKKFELIKGHDGV